MPRMYDVRCTVYDIPKPTGVPLLFRLAYTVHRKSYISLVRNFYQMKKGFMLLGFIIQLFSGKAQKTDYSKYPVYTGNDLGLTYTKTKSVFKIWAPTAQAVRLYLDDVIP